MQFLDQKTSKKYIIARYVSIGFFLCCIHGGQAFAPVQKIGFHSFGSNVRDPVTKKSPLNSSNSMVKLYSASDDEKATNSNVSAEPFSHEKVSWKIKPWIKNKSANSNILSLSSNLLEKGVLKIASNLIRLDCKLNKKNPPKVLCPKSGQAVLEAYVKREKGLRALLPFKRKVARFGITTHRGPPEPQILSTVEQVYNITMNVEPGVAAIIYMYVEPEYRSTGLGELALEVISSIHAFQRCDFTILVADDDGSGKLVEWYGTNGFEKAPLLQEMMGSPDGKFGTTMIRPTGISPKFYDKCKIQWW